MYTLYQQDIPITKARIWSGEHLAYPREFEIEDAIHILHRSVGIVPNVWMEVIRE